MTGQRFIVIQINMAKHPRQIVSEHHTGDGVLFPVSSDGYYTSRKDAEGVAAWLSKRHPNMRTHVVEVVNVIAAQHEATHV